MDIDKVNKIAWPEKSTIGYIDCAASGEVAALTKEIMNAYNVAIFSFLDSNGNIPSLTPSFNSTVSNVMAMEQEGTLNLASIGGGGKTVNIGPSSVDATVDNVIDAITELKLDGVDLDIEDPSIPISDILTFSQKLRAALTDKGLLLTCAPILAGNNTHPELVTPRGASWKEVYGPDGVVFDSINVQAYNSGTSFLYEDPQSKELVGESNPNIVMAAYDALQKRGNIHQNSKISIGVPANIKSANSSSNCWSFDTTDDDIAKTLVQNVKSIIGNEYGMDSKQFGGLMTWSITNDAYFSDPKGFFSSQVADVIKSSG